VRESDSGVEQSGEMWTYAMADWEIIVEETTTDIS